MNPNQKTPSWNNNTTSLGIGLKSVWFQLLYFDWIFIKRCIHIVITVVNWIVKTNLHPGIGLGLVWFQLLSSLLQWSSSNGETRCLLSIIHPPPASCSHKIFLHHWLLHQSSAVKKSYNCCTRVILTYLNILMWFCTRFARRGWPQLITHCHKTILSHK